MGLLVNGKWQDKWYDTKESGGKFVREDSQFRQTIVPANEVNNKDEDFIAEANRYHLYVSLACPWAHRTLIFRKLKGLENIIDVSVVSPDMLENGWEFSVENNLPDHLFHSDYLYQVYLKADSQYSGRVTVPILWDKKTGTIVSNESADIIRMFNTAFNDVTNNTVDFYPAPIKQEIDEINEFVYHNINNGVYKCGFATTQAAYEEAFDKLFSALDKVEEMLSSHTYLVESTLTEADWRLFTTLIRFDAVYVGHFKCNKQRIQDYHHIFEYMKRLYQTPGIKETVNFEHIKRHYYYSHKTINPTQIVPKGPSFSLDVML
ncbi:glutathione S-transferase family protein [Flocculibacter collagenilyticus]|uniref:glutathione S-transferase family protein n=1 Tax=Flocculibacter collagenilyticus TaxID=2744479 RepID=UPI0018F42797|nr:glutathione S-transferase family protein [Flocculibacter collagenilyticus]